MLGKVTKFGGYSFNGLEGTNLQSWGGLTWSIMQKHEHNFRQNAMFSGVTLKGIMLEFWGIIYLTLMQGV